MEDELPEAQADVYTLIYGRRSNLGGATKEVRGFFQTNHCH